MMENWKEKAIRTTDMHGYLYTFNISLLGDGGQWERKLLKSMAIYSLSPKSDAVSSCQIDPEKFVESIMADETRANHSEHSVKTPRKNAVKLDDVDVNEIVNQIRKRWAKTAGFFVKDLWVYIVTAIFTDQDKSVSTFNQVEVITKDILQFSD